MSMRESYPLINRNSSNVNAEKSESTDRFRTECIAFIKNGRWEWLLSLLFLVFVPAILLAPSSYGLWLLLNICGFTYVSAATCERKNPIDGRSNGAREFVKLMLSTPLTFLLGPYWTLLPLDCNLLVESSEWHFFSLTSDCNRTIWSPRISSIVYMDGLGISNTTSYSGFLYYFIYNYFFYVLPFFIGLHFTYLDYIPFLQAIVFNRDGIRRLRLNHWIFLAVTALFIGSLIAFHCILFFQSKKWIFYLFGFSFLAVLFSIVSFYNIKLRGMSFHIHHYQIFGFLFALMPFQNIVSSFFQALAAGIFVEGIARWGMDRSFLKKL